MRGSESVSLRTDWKRYMHLGPGCLNMNFFIRIQFEFKLFSSTINNVHKSLGSHFGTKQANK